MLLNTTRAYNDCTRNSSYPRTHGRCFQPQLAHHHRVVLQKEGTGGEQEPVLPSFLWPASTSLPEEYEIIIT